MSTIWDHDSNIFFLNFNLLFCCSGQNFWNLRIWYWTANSGDWYHQVRGLAIVLISKWRLELGMSIWISTLILSAYCSKDLKGMLHLHKISCVSWINNCGTCCQNETSVYMVKNSKFELLIVTHAVKMRLLCTLSKTQNLSYWLWPMLSKWDFCAHGQNLKYWYIMKCTFFHL